MAKVTKAKKDNEVEVLKIDVGSVKMRILGKTPLICNAMSAKVAQGLLLPAKKKNTAERQGTLKHDVLAEYRDSVYRLTAEDAPTRIGVKALSFKSAMRDVALDMPGMAKSQLGRLTYVEGDILPVWGVPQIRMDVVRNSDMKRTPDVRTRATLPQWATEIVVRHTTPIVKAGDVAKLMAAAGLLRGVGDFRPEKGAGTFGQFEIVEEDDPRWLLVVKEGGKVAQDAALLDPAPFDEETQSLLSWYQAEVQRRGFKTVA